jgi:hypothetical protein
LYGYLAELREELCPVAFADLAPPGAVTAACGVPDRLDDEGPCGTPPELFNGLFNSGMERREFNGASSLCVHDGLRAPALIDVTLAAFGYRAVHSS